MIINIHTAAYTFLQATFASLQCFIKRFVAASCCLLALCVFPSAATAFVNFESGQTRPLAYIPVTNDGSLLFAANTPDSRVEIYRVRNQLRHLDSVPVGLEPVAIAARTADEVWVVNHLSDSVSILKNGANGWSVVNTLQVGDEPRDIVFAGPNRSRAFITSADRNLDRPLNSKIGNASLWVFDAENPGNAPVTVMNLFTSEPRALTVSPDGNKVYVAALNSGNQTTIIDELLVGSDPPSPLTNIEGEPAPSVGLIVKNVNGKWIDGAGRDLSDKVGPLTITDFDVFTVDAAAEPLPVLGQVYTGVGSTLFNMVANPQNDEVYVSNLNAMNHVRFEGPGVFGGSTVRGHIAENRITVLKGRRTFARHLNKHIDYDADPSVPDPATNNSSLAFPLDMAISSDGKTLYVTAFGSSKIGIFDTKKLTQDTFIPDPDNHIELSGGGPSGVILDETRNRLYVLTRFDNAISVINLGSKNEVEHVAMHNPEPLSVVAGRPFLYDARLTSTRGDSACASCHIFGDKDDLAWDLGNPDDVVKDNPNPLQAPARPGFDTSFHPMKGAMTTQSLRGMANHGPMHWRGDRTGGHTGGDPLDEEAAFKAFNVAFEGLIGRSGPLTTSQMQSFTDFALQLFYPPNPIRNIDNSLTVSQLKGREFFFNVPTIPFSGETCNDCHVVDIENGFFGSNGLSVAIPGASQVMKVPHLRNAYTKAGTSESDEVVVSTRFKGFGFTHDGSAPTLLRFLRAGRFEFPALASAQDVANYVMAIDSNLAPIVGQQVTLSDTSGTAAASKLGVMIQRALVSNPRAECDLIAKAAIAGEKRGWLLQATRDFRSDRVAEAPYDLQSLMDIAKAPDQAMTFTCVPPGSGQRMGIDRDEDGILDGDDSANRWWQNVSK